MSFKVYWKEIPRNNHEWLYEEGDPSKVVLKGFDDESTQVIILDVSWTHVLSGEGMTTELGVDEGPYLASDLIGAYTGIKLSWGELTNNIPNYSYTVITQPPSEPGIPLPLNGAGFRVSSAGEFTLDEFKADMAQWIRNIQPTSMPDWESATIVFYDVYYNQGGFLAHAWVPIIYESNFGDEELLEPT